MKGLDKFTVFSSQFLEITLSIEGKESFMKSNEHGFYKLKNYMTHCIRIAFQDEEVLASLLNEEESFALNLALGEDNVLLLFSKGPTRT